jgi:gluconokinase
MDKRLLVMGVSGAGKTTLAEALARRLDAAFIDADDLHPPTNRAKMAAGEPLDDADRAPWLDAVAQVITGWVAIGQAGVIACSALKRAYRDRLREADLSLVTVYLDVEETELRRRLARRRGHFFPAELLASQLAVLEPPTRDEGVVSVSGQLTVDEAVEEILRRLSSAQLDSELGRQ